MATMKMMTTVLRPARILKSPPFPTSRHLSTTVGLDCPARSRTNTQDFLEHRQRSVYTAIRGLHPEDKLLVGCGNAVMKPLGWRDDVLVDSELIDLVNGTPPFFPYLCMWKMGNKLLWEVRTHPLSLWWACVPFPPLSRQFW